MGNSNDMPVSKQALAHCSMSSRQVKIYLGCKSQLSDCRNFSVSKVQSASKILTHVHCIKRMQAVRNSGSSLRTSRVRLRNSQLSSLPAIHRPHTASQSSRGPRSPIPHGRLGEPRTDNTNALPSFAAHKPIGARTRIRGARSRVLPRF